MRFGLARVLALAAVATPSLAGQAPSPTPIERLAPCNAVAVVQAVELGKLAAAFDQSALGQAVKRSRLLSYARNLAGTAADFASALLSGLPPDEWRACLGSHAGLVLLDFKDAADFRQRAPIVLLVQAAEPRKLEATLLAQLRLLATLRPQVAVTQARELGVTVHQVALPKGVTLAWCLLQDTLVVGRREGVKAFLGTQVGGMPRLAADPGYQALRQRLALDAGLLVYVNVQALAQRTPLGQAMHPEGPLAKLGIAGVQAAGLAIDFAGRQVRERLAVTLGGQPSGLLRLLTDGQPVAFAGPRHVPKGYSVVLSMATRDVGLWQRLRNLTDDLQGPAAGDLMETVGNAIEQNLGVHPKTGLFDAFGDEVFLALDLSKLPAFFGTGHQPKPLELPFLFGSKLRDAATLKSTSDRIAANQALWEKGVQRTSTKYGDTSVFTFRIPMNPQVRPSHATAGDLFLFAIHPQPVVDALEAARTGKTFAPREAPPAPPAHVSLRVNAGQVLRALLECVRDDLPESAAPLVAEADKLFASLGTYQATLRREPPGLVLETRSDLGTLGTFIPALVMLDQGNAIVARRVQADFEQIARALEAYREKRGAYPETLDQLVPDYLPQLVNDRFAPARPYGYSRGRPGPDGGPPDAWIVTSVGPDKKPNIPVEQFDPPVWAARLRTQDPQEIEALKRAIYRFRPEQFPDERKNDDEGDLYRMGGKGLAARPAPPAAPAAPEKPKQRGVQKKQTF